MNQKHNYWDIVYGIDTRARLKGKEEEKNYFENPLVHRQINGDEIYVPLDINRLWKN
ncbi:hypothetical protein [Aquibacillus sediminis]|uniref:hypothetical protein n=1 Tax=Aquibacillus sediminis TaxID=2574734 RepID=UPI00148690DF|nr:hypothetical protein [Aquibacillus sediminis]